MQRNVVMPHSPRGQTAFPIEAPGLQCFGVIMLEMFWPELAHSYGTPRRPSQSGGLFQKVKDAILLEEFAAKFTDLRRQRGPTGSRASAPSTRSVRGRSTSTWTSRPGAASAPAPQAAT